MRAVGVRVCVCVCKECGSTKQVEEVQDKGGRPRIVGRKAEDKEKIFNFVQINIDFPRLDKFSFIFISTTSFGLFGLNPDFRQERDLTYLQFSNGFPRPIRFPSNRKPERRFVFAEQSGVDAITRRSTVKRTLGAPPKIRDRAGAPASFPPPRTHGCLAQREIAD